MTARMFSAKFMDHLLPKYRSLVYIILVLFLMLFYLIILDHCPNYIKKTLHF